MRIMKWFDLCFCGGKAPLNNLLLNSFLWQ